LSLDLESDLRAPDKRVRLLEDDRKLESLRRVLQREKVPLTCFTVMSLVSQYPNELKELERSLDIEFAVHSFSHDTSQPASLYQVQQSWDTFGEFWGREPAGYRSPNCLIDEAGLLRLARQGYRYDSSIVPSVRFDEYGYNNLSYSRMPFKFQFANHSIVEFPIACLAGLRLPFVFSYAKLLGMPVYRAVSALFPLPDLTVTYFHPYDLYAGEISQNLRGWKRHAHLRGADRAPAILSECIAMLKGRGYSFVKLEDLARSYQAGQPLPTVMAGGELAPAT
jgi:peptidoglycan/xylan/chitin deacetylase (PgdA/CDA1 family)